ncbi:MAG TPA: tetratricopeptide repeat protein [Rhizomicrobium sp.]|nr:tetratricopeptide repeat protein [Rhizomicrobium sp.]
MSAVLQYIDIDQGVAIAVACVALGLTKGQSRFWLLLASALVILGKGLLKLVWFGPSLIPNSAVPYIGFAFVAVIAIIFAAIPLFRIEKAKTRYLLLAAAVLFIIGVGGGSYYLIGRPHLAQREASGLNTREVSGLVPFLIQRVRQYPGDARAWRYLGEAYMAAKDPRDAAKAFAKVIELTGRGDAALNAAYGEALVAASNGAVPPEAEKAFTAALAADPTSAPARFYLGLAKAERKDYAGAIQLWQSLLADIPATAPLHQILVDRIAILTSQSMGQSPGGAPNPRAMVEMLAARLKADPNDALGWVRLMRAYTVLGETQKAKQALVSARKAFADNKDAQTAFTTAAKALKLN